MVKETCLAEETWILTTLLIVQRDSVARRGIGLIEIGDNKRIEGTMRNEKGIAKN